MSPMYSCVLSVRVDGDMLKGILLEAREKETNKIIGSFIELLTDRRYKRFQTIDCNGKLHKEQGHCGYLPP